MRRQSNSRWLVLLAVLLTSIALAGTGLAVLARSGPEGRIVLGVGGSDGAYLHLAQTYQADLERNGIKLELRNDLQGWDVLRAVGDPAAPIHGGIVKGGLMGSLTGRLASSKARDRHEEEAIKSRSLGRLFLEPIWVFTRGSLPISSLRELAGKRILAGTRQGGARRIAAQLLRANGVNRDNTVLLEGDLDDKATALANGTADAAILVLPPDADRIQRLLRVPGIRLMDFSPEIDAYTSRFPALRKVVLSRASVEFDPVIPSADITLLATSAVLIVRSDLHPALSSLLASVVIAHPKSSIDQSGDPVLFHRPGAFPTSDDPEFGVASEVRMLYKTGELPLLLRGFAPLNHRLGLPFSLTAFANAYGVQAGLLLIPALTILLPLVRLVPILYRWAVRQRLLHWYRELKVLERSLDRDQSGEQVTAQLAEIDRIDAVVRRIKVPLEFSDQFYDLRGHIELVQRRLQQRLTGLQAAE